LIELFLIYRYEYIISFQFSRFLWYYNFWNYIYYLLLMLCWH